MSQDFYSGEQTREVLDLKTFDSLMAGSQNGKIIIPSDFHSTTC
jgi:hypothetical protein